MRGEDGADAVDDRAAVGFEGVGGIVEAVAKEDADEEVCGAVQRELEGRIVDHSAVLQEATAEDAVVAFIEGLPVANDITAVVGFVGHHNNHGITAHGVEAFGDRTPEAVRAGILNRAEGGDFGGFALEDLPSGVGGTIVHHDDFVWHSVEGKLEVEVLDGGGDAALLIPHGDDNREQRERSGRLGFRSAGHFCLSKRRDRRHGPGWRR